MNDEIKEILDSIKEQSEEENWIQLSPEFIKPLIDYITNLQQENQELKKKLDRRYYKNEYERLKQENERLKEIKPCMINFQECYVIKDYKSRCEKAIEYIKNDWYKSNTLDIEHCVNLGKDIRIDLLNILKNGGDKE